MRVLVVYEDSHRASEDPDGPSEVCVAGRRRRGAQNPGMEELLAVIDETEGLVRTGGRLGGC